MSCPAFTVYRGSLLPGRTTVPLVIDRVRLTLNNTRFRSKRSRADQYQSTSTDCDTNEYFPSARCPLGTGNSSQHR